MLGALARSLFGTANDRIVKGFDKPVAKINALEPELAKLSDEQLRAKTIEFRERLAKGETLDDLLVEAFAVVREAAKRTLGQRHFDVQLKGGMVLHQGKIAEMKTGEGKTLVATLPVYLNALEGKGVHVVTVNDYLAKRDSEWMGQIYQFLGLTVGVIVHELDDEQRKAAYACDVTYGTNNELGFDYLRDNMKFRLDAMAQRPFNYAIVDEVDSILIDEARTPLIISGPAEDSSELYRRADTVIPRLKADAFEKDEKNRTVVLTDAGVEAVEDILRGDGLLPEGISLYAPNQVTVLHHVTQALRAHKLFARDTDYIVKDGQVVIIDEFTGRMMAGRRYSEGLHQALEAKEKVEIQRENQTLASITFQNLFRMYPKLAGMTGTAMTEAAEFGEIYRLEVVEIPTNVAVARKDADDEIYRTLADKTRAIVKLVQECRERQQPMLVGTVSIEKSEALSEELKKAKIPHNVLNARYHEQEAEIVAQAGRPGAITIATNMAGRGTDIQLGGNADMLVRQSEPEITAKFPDEAARKAEIERVAAEIRAEVLRNREIVLKAGGLYVVGTERHESRRIDNQLRGRSGRQGDPGASKFFLSLEDDLMRIFGNNKVLDWVQKKGMADDEALTHRWLNKALETAQGKVEARNFEIRKNLLRFDDVMNSQRKEIYKERIELMGDRGRLGHHRRHAPRRDRHAGRPDHPRGRLRRAVEDRRAQGRGAAHLRARPAGRGLGQGRGHRRRGDQDPAERPGRPAVCPARGAVRAGRLAPGREERADAALRPELEGAPAPSRPSAPGHRLARLRPEGSAERVQARGVQSLQRPPDRPARAGGGPAGDAAAAHGAAADAGDADQHAGDPRGSCAGEPDERRPGVRSGRSRRRRRAHAASAAADGASRQGSQRSRDLGQGRAQRALPLRLRQEVQALPRAGSKTPCHPERSEGPLRP